MSCTIHHPANYRNLECVDCRRSSRGVPRGLVFVRAGLLAVGEWRLMDLLDSLHVLSIRAEIRRTTQSSSTETETTGGCARGECRHECRRGAATRAIPGWSRGCEANFDHRETTAQIKVSIDRLGGDIRDLQ